MLVRVLTLLLSASLAMPLDVCSVLYGVGPLLYSSDSVLNAMNAELAAVQGHDQFWSQGTLPFGAPGVSTADSIEALQAWCEEAQIHGRGSETEVVWKFGAPLGRCTGVVRPSSVVHIPRKLLAEKMRNRVLF